MRRACPLIWVGALLLAAACSGSSGSSVTSTSPTPDAVTRNYVALVHNYWVQVLAVEGDTNGVKVMAGLCYGKSGPDSSTNLALVDPAQCHDRAVAMLAVQRYFLGDLAVIPVPPQFANDNTVIMAQVTKEIADFQGVIAATATGSKTAVVQATAAAAADVGPLNSALSHVDPSFVEPL